MKFKEYDVIIVGTGVSGLYAALNLDSSMQILMLSKRELTLCNSALAQGGVAAVMDTSNDNYELHIKDTLIAGGYKNNIDNVRILVEQGPTLRICSIMELTLTESRTAQSTLPLRAVTAVTESLTTRTAPALR